MLRAATWIVAWAGLLVGAAEPAAATDAAAPWPMPPAAPGDWPALGNDPGGSQYSPLAQIHAGNVAGLKLAWVHRSGDVAFFF